MRANGRHPPDGAIHGGKGEGPLRTTVPSSSAGTVPVAVSGSASSAFAQLSARIFATSAFNAAAAAPRACLLMRPARCLESGSRTTRECERRQQASEPQGSEVSALNS